VQIPYASKLLIQELETMCISSRILTQGKLIRRPLAIADEGGYSAAQGIVEKAGGGAGGP
jgi:hypothetical protein